MEINTTKNLQLILELNFCFPEGLVQSNSINAYQHQIERKRMP